MNRLQRQTLALGLISVSSAALYWVEASWLVWGLMGSIAAGMLLSIPDEGES